MIRLVALIVPSLLLSFDIQGYIGSEYRAFDNENSSKAKHSSALEVNIELKHRGSEYSFASTADFLKDFDDSSRTYARLNEIYLTKHFENSDFSVGRRVYFMGALEVLNPVDIISRQNFGRDALDDRYRIGTYMAMYEYYSDEVQVSLSAFGSERADEFGSASSVYNIFQTNISKKLQSQNSKNSPSIMLKVQGTLDEEYALDYAIGILRGYDAQRTFSQKLEQEQWLSTTAFTYNTLALDNTLYKFEARVSDIDKNKEARMDDYIYWGAGIEHTLAAVYENTDVGLLAEYYNWVRLDSNYMSSDSMMVLMQNDLFLGLRVAMNNSSSTEIVGGVIVDLVDSNEQSYYTQVKSRIFDTFLLDLDLRYLSPSNNRITMMSLIGEHSRATVNVRYYF